ncbi:MAG: hypothetical protein HY579_01350 [Nitrospinae bacterium]|nr:hypothetical protein [Nitrospinota bacterium]
MLVSSSRFQMKPDQSNFQGNRDDPTSISRILQANFFGSGNINKNNGLERAATGIANGLPGERFSEAPETGLEVAMRLSGVFQGA